MKATLAILTILFALQVPRICQCQDRAVHWRVQATRVNPEEVMLSLTAGISPGWHIFSQSLKTGDLLPTKIIFRQTGDYLLIGSTMEAGNASRYYDNSLEVTQYSGTVTFLQRAKINPAGTTIHGTVEYMVCNHCMCIPGKQEFSIELPVMPKAP